MLTRDHCFIWNFFNKTFPLRFSDVKVEAGRKAEKAKEEADNDKSSRRHFIHRFSDRTLFFDNVKKLIYYVKLSIYLGTLFNAVLEDRILTRSDLYFVIFTGE
jgi:hypothetical protein